MNPSVNKFVVGIEIGSDSVRAVLMRVEDGAEVRTAVQSYERWAKLMYCEPSKQQYRQHPLDHVEAMTRAVRALFVDKGVNVRNVVGIGVGAAGSSPLPVGPDARPLGLYDEFKDDPDALCVLWKDRTAVAEAEEINELCHSGRVADYTKFAGGVYSPESFWAKILHVHRANDRVAASAASWVELCDWIPALLAGVRHPANIVRSRCAAGHKALWSPEFGGLPGRDFFEALDKRLLTLPCPLYDNPVPSDHAAGRLCPEWANRLGLPEGLVIAAGAFDTHMSAVGAGIVPYTLVRAMGASACDLLIAPPQDVGDALVRGINGQVPDSVLPGYVGFEAGPAPFGEVSAWFGNLLSWGAAADRGPALLPRLAEAAAALPPGGNGEIVIGGLRMASDAPAVYRALVETAAYGGRAIIDRFEDEGIPVKAVVALGGLAKSSPPVMQICADVFNRPIGVVASEDCCARGAGIFAAAAAGEYRTSIEAREAMASAIEAEYHPNPANAGIYQTLYANHQALGPLARAQAAGA
jgi:L-ribulokinase